MTEQLKTGTPVPITVDLLPDNRMYFRNDWISGSLGDVEFAINQVMNGPVVHIKYGSQNFTLDLSQVVEAMPEVLLKMESPTVCIESDPMPFRDPNPSRSIPRR